MSEYIGIIEEMDRDFHARKHEYLSKIKKIAEKYNARAYIFGSHARGKALAGSDVDVLIILPPEVDRLKVLNELSRELKNRKFEFHVLNKKEGEYFLKIIGEYVEI